MQTRLKSIYGLIIIAAAAMLFYPGAAEAEDLTEMVIRQNEASHHAIQSIMYTIDIETHGWQHKEEPFHDIATATVTQKGRLRSVTHQSKWGAVLPSGVRGEPKRMEHRSVLNDQFMAHWAANEPTPVTMVELASAASLTEEQRGELSVLTGDDYLLRAFGNGTQTLREWYEGSKDRVKWETTEIVTPDGQKKFLVRRTVIKTGESIGETELDPQQGFLITRFTTFDWDGLPGMEVRVDPVQIGGCWVPQAINLMRTRHFVYRSRKDIKEEEKTGLYQQSRMSLRQVVVNGDISDSAFQVASLGLPENKLVFKKDQRGAKTEMMYKQGTLIPRAVGEALVADEARASNAISK